MRRPIQVDEDSDSENDVQQCESVALKRARVAVCLSIDRGVGSRVRIHAGENMLVELLFRYGMVEPGGILEIYIGELAGSWCVWECS